MGTLKFFAKVNLKRKEEAASILNAFIEEFHPQSSILISGGILKTEVFFENPPKRIVEAISNCDDFEFRSGKFFEDTDEESNQFDKQTTNESNEPIVIKEGENTLEESEAKEPKISKTDSIESEDISITKSAISEDSVSEAVSEDTGNKPKRKYSKASENVQSEELEKIAKESSSYDDFVNKVADWIDFKKRKELFLHVIDAASKIEKITWKNLEEFLAPENILITPSVQTVLGKAILEAFKNSKSPLRPMELFGAIVSYKNYSFNENVATEKNSYSAEECLNSIFSDINKDQPVKERIWDALVAIGVFKAPEKERNAIIEISKKAIGEKMIDIKELCFAVCGEENEFINDVRLTFSKIINQFLKESECKEEITVDEFLSMLQKGVLTEVELEEVIN